MSAVTRQAAEIWPSIPLSEVANLLRGVSYPKSDVRGEATPGYVPVLRATNIQDACLNLIADLVFVAKRHVSPEQHLRRGDIVVATSSGSKHLVGKSAQFHGDWDGSFGAFCATVRPKPNIEPDYLAFFLQSPYYWKQITKKVVGVNINNLRRGDLESLTLPFPPLDQQRGIVAEIEKQLSRLDESVANLRRVNSNIKRYKDAVLTAAVDGRLVPIEAELARCVGRGFESGEQLLGRVLVERRASWDEKAATAGRNRKYVEPRPPDLSNLPPLPKGWAWATLGQLAWSVRDGPHYSPKYVDQGIPFITGGQVRPEGIDFSTARFISPGLHGELSRRCKPELGDMLYTKGGTTGIARVNTDGREFNVWVHVAVLKLVPSIHRFYLQHALNSPHCFRQAQQYTHGVGNQDLGLTRMVWITVPLPPLAEQERIVSEIDRCLSITVEIERELRTELQRAERLRSSLLSRVFAERDDQA